jgi:hypothetical protein
MADSDRLVRLISHALPRELRERVFEPALADLRLREAEGSERLPRWLARLILLLECVRLSIPRAFWRRGRPTRLAIGLLVTLTLFRLLLARQGYMPR